MSLLSDAELQECKIVEDSIFSNFEKFKNQACLTGIKLDPFHVKVAVTSYLKDLKRFAVFHDSAPNEYKHAAFLVYWLIKIRPISSTHINPPEFQINSVYLAVNEEFAIFNALALMKIKQSHIQDKTLLSRLVYAFYYRDFNAKSLIFIMELLHKATPVYLRSSVSKIRLRFCVSLN
jgi:hypothetical protein